MTTSLKPLYWKETRESLWALYAALGAFIVFGAMNFYSTLRTDRLYGGDGANISSGLDEGLMQVFGPVVALLLGVFAACRDLPASVQSFWRSRPIPVGRFVAVKYRTGLAIVWAVFLIPLVPELIWAANKTGRASSGNWPLRLDSISTVLAYWGFIMTLIYSVSFLVGVLVRDATRAAILSLAAALVLLFLPIVFPPLEPANLLSILEEEPTRFNIEQYHNGKFQFQDWMNRWTLTVPVYRSVALSFSCGPRYPQFVVGTLALSAVALCLAGVALKRDWRIHMDQKLLCWTLGLIALTMLGSAAYQVGSNLEPVEFINPVTSPRMIKHAVESSGKGFIVTENGDYLHWDTQKDLPLYAQTFDLRSNPPTLSAEITLPMRHHPQQFLWIASDESRPDEAWFLLQKYESHNAEKPWEHGPVTSVRLGGVKIDAQAQSATIIREIDLTEHFKGLSDLSVQRFQIRGDTVRLDVYFKGVWNYFRVELGDTPVVRELLAAEVLRRATFSESGSPTGLRVGVAIPDQPGADTDALIDQAIEEAMGQWSGYEYKDSQLVVMRSGSLITFGPPTIKDGQAEFQSVFMRRQRLLERIVEPNTTPRMVLSNGLLFAASQSLMVFDLHDPHHPKKVGHFARPEMRYIAAVVPTSNGRILVAADKLYLFDPADWKR